MDFLPTAERRDALSMARASMTKYPLIIAPAVAVAILIGDAEGVTALAILAEKYGTMDAIERGGVALMSGFVQSDVVTRVTGECGR